MPIRSDHIYPNTGGLTLPTDDKWRLLGTRATACVDEWPPGSLFWYYDTAKTTTGGRPRRTTRSMKLTNLQEGYGEDTIVWPDFRDPATKGGLLELVRRVWDDEVLSPAFNPDFNGWELTTCILCAPTPKERGDADGPLIETFRFESDIEMGVLVSALECFFSLPEPSLR